MIDQLHRVIESVIDPAQPSLSENVFRYGEDGTYSLHTSIRFKILRVWGHINTVCPTGKVLIVGGIATYNYSEDSDIDVTIQAIGTDDQAYDMARRFAMDQNAKENAGPHEINYYVKRGIDYLDYDSIYDVIGDRWLKGPAEVGIDIDRYLGRFEKVVGGIDADKAELLEDLGDYEQLKHFDDSGRQTATKVVKKKLREIELDLESLRAEYHDVHRSRLEAFEETDLARIKEYGSRNSLPENVVYLLLRRYCYINFLHALSKIVDDRLQPAEVPEIERTVQKFNSCKVRQGFDAKLNEGLEEFGDFDPDDTLDDDDRFEEHDYFYLYGRLLRPKNFDTDEFSDADLEKSALTSFAVTIEQEANDVDCHGSGIVGTEDGPRRYISDRISNVVGDRPPKQWLPLMREHDLIQRVCYFEVTGTRSDLQEFLMANPVTQINTVPPSWIMLAGMTEEP